MNRFSILTLVLILIGVLEAISFDACSRAAQKKMILGRSEVVCLPEWGITLNAKIDTGAYRSSLHVSHIEHLEDKPNSVRFQTIDRYGKTHVVEAKIAKQVRVRSSFGRVRERFVVRTNICLAGQEFAVLVSLSDRSDMRFPMLVGRQYLKKRFLIDPTLEYTVQDQCCPAS